MNQKQRFRPTPSFVVSCVALFVAMSGTAVALKGKNSVDSGDIKPGAVKTTDIQSGAVKTPELGREAVQAPNIGLQTIGSQQLAFHAVKSSNLNDGAVSASKLGDINVVKNVFFVSDFTTGHAQCPVGQVLLSGGVQLDSGTTNGVPSTHLIASGPDLSADAPRTWFGQASTAGLGTMTVYAVCLQ